MSSVPKAFPRPDIAADKAGAGLDDDPAAVRKLDVDPACRAIDLTKDRRRKRQALVLGNIHPLRITSLHIGIARPDSEGAGFGHPALDSESFWRPGPGNVIGNGPEAPDPISQVAGKARIPKQLGRSILCGQTPINRSDGLGRGCHGRLQSGNRRRVQAGLRHHRVDPRAQATVGVGVGLNFCRNSA